ncbi:MAG: hypothetical protein EOP05_04810 [Proteobacteria bacterium]|nr:MAG: hypothetical protein EOP05_04810 [Pseudomonadota bacterium]
MKTTTFETTPVAHDHKESFICWRSAFAGLFITLFTFVGLIALGMAFGGHGLDDGSSLANAGRFSAIWFLGSILISLFAGSFFSSRVARRAHAHIGATQGLLVASLFFAILLYQTASTIGAIGRAAGSTISAGASAASTGLAAAANSSTVNEIIEDSMGGTKVAPERLQAVVTGVAARLANGRPDSARNYLMRETGVTQAEADQRLATLKTQVDEAAVKTREATATALKATGWMLFLTMVIGAMAAAVGGALGSHMNLKRPFYEYEEERVRGTTRPGGPVRA